MDIKDVIIIGGGPSGVTAGVYLKRYGKNIVIINKGFIGGAVTTTHMVDNYPGFYNVSGFDLSLHFKNQLDSLDVPIYKEEVLSVSKDNNIFIVKTNKNSYYSKYVIVSTGRVHNKLGIPTEEKYIGNGISYCSTCDAPFTKDKKVIVVGGGNSAFEETLFISKFAKNVKILVRNGIKADHLLQEKVRSLPNVEILCKEEVLEIIGDERIEKIKTNNAEYETDFLFVFIGLTPKFDFLNGLNVNVKNKAILVNDKMETSVSGLYAAGDVIYKDLYQIITSAAEGASAAYSINQEMEK